MKSSYLFIILLLSIFYKLITSKLIVTSPERNLNDNITTQTSTSTTSFFNTTKSGITTTNSSTTTSRSSERIPVESTISTIIIFRSTSIISDLVNDRPSKSLSRTTWWLLIALIVAVVVLISIAIIFHQRRHSPYRRFLQNWRSRDEDADNIVLQLEQPEIIDSHWPPRISFA